MAEVNFAEMISKIAHELRSPLTSVKGFSATLIKRWDRFTDEQRFQFVETIHADAERMGRIVSEVLDLARLESGRLELHPAEVDLAALIDQVVTDFGAERGSGRIEVTVAAGSSAWGDRDRLAHVVSNLIENALKFTDGPVRVETSTEDGDVELAVTDEGPGIEPDRLPELFSGPAPAGQRSGPSGTGLGLYLTRRLVEAHRGSISVQSDPLTGSTFTVTLPAGPPG